MCAFTNTADRSRLSKKNFPIFAFSLSPKKKKIILREVKQTKKWMKIPKLSKAPLISFVPIVLMDWIRAKGITSDVSLSYRPPPSSSFVRPMILAPPWQLAKCFQAQLEVSETGEVESHHKRLMTLSGFLPGISGDWNRKKRSKNVSLVGKLLNPSSAYMLDEYFSGTSFKHEQMQSLVLRLQFTSQSRLLWVCQRWENWKAANNMYTLLLHNVSTNSMLSEANFQRTLIDIALMFVRCETFFTQQLFPSFFAL